MGELFNLRISTMSGDYEPLALENPLLDIQGGNEELLKKYDLKANDAILAEEKHMGLFEDLLKTDAKLIPGGAAQNTARGAAYILPQKSVVFIGCVGKDKYADTLRTESEKQGVRVEYRIDDEQPTGRCGVVITGKNRSLCTDLAAANLYNIEHLKKPEIWSLVEQAKVYYVGGYHLTVSPPAILTLAEEAAAKNKIFILNLSAPFIAQFFKEPLDKTSPYWDYLIGNESEAEAWGKAHGLPPTSNVEDIAKEMASLPKKNDQRKRVVVITQGTEPTLVAQQAHDGEVTLSKYPVRAIGEEKIVDTNGAGDAFAGGFVAAIVQGKDLKTAVDMGQWLALLSIQELGPSYPTPKQTYTA